MKQCKLCENKLGGHKSTYCSFVCEARGTRLRNNPLLQSILVLLAQRGDEGARLDDHEKRVNILIDWGYAAMDDKSVVITAKGRRASESYVFEESA